MCVYLRQYVPVRMPACVHVCLCVCGGRGDNASRKPAVFSVTLVKI